MYVHVFKCFSMSVKLFLAIPCYSQKIQLECALSIVQLNNTMQQRGITVQMSGLTGESLLFIARNVLVKHFLNSGCTHLLFIDDDIKFDAEDIDRMIQADKDLIGGAYSSKNTSNPSIVCTMLENDVNVESDIVNVKHVGTGLMLIKRRVFEHMLQYTTEIDHNGEPLLLFFDHKTGSGTYMSEDYYFCDKWRQCGGDVFLAKFTNTIHYGNIGFPHGKN